MASQNNYQFSESSFSSPSRTSKTRLLSYQLSSDNSYNKDIDEEANINNNNNNKNGGDTIDFIPPVSFVELPLHRAPSPGMHAMMMSDDSTVHIDNIKNHDSIRSLSYSENGSNIKVSNNNNNNNVDKNRGKEDAENTDTAIPTSESSSGGFGDDSSGFGSDKIFRSLSSQKECYDTNNEQHQPTYNNNSNSNINDKSSSSSQYESFRSLIKKGRISNNDRSDTYFQSSSYRKSAGQQQQQQQYYYDIPDSDVSVLSHPSHSKQDKDISEDDQSDLDDESNTYAQSFILALAFMAVWSPQNLMAPNLTQMADFFQFSASERDKFLGADIAFATGVLSLPVSGVVGFLADIVKSRRDLYAMTVLVGGVASFWCANCQTYTQLYIARFVNGGCMAGCTPVAFSLLGDLFETKQRNAASSGLTAMMGLGIILGQVLAGEFGPAYGWRLPFQVASILCWICALLVMLYVDEPERGGKEEALQEMIKRGKAYDRKLTLDGFLHAMTQNYSNFLLMIQGFFSSVPWGCIFVFLNDYLSQEQGLSVPDATFLVFLYGVGSAVGGLLGGYLGQETTAMKRSYMPIFMAVTTIAGIFPFLGLLNIDFGGRDGPIAIFLSLSAGVIANLPSVNIRPCLINVNPPEMRGAALTASNAIINLARGIGPCFLTWICAIFKVNRQFSFNVLIIFFWFVAGIQLFMLAGTLPHDQDRMEEELSRYAETLAMQAQQDKQDPEDGDNEEEPSTIADIPSFNDDSHTVTDSVVSIEDRIISFDAEAARQSLLFMSGTLKEISHGALNLGRRRSLAGHHPQTRAFHGSWEKIDSVPVAVKRSKSCGAKSINNTTTVSSSSSYTKNQKKASSYHHNMDRYEQTFVSSSSLTSNNDVNNLEEGNNTDESSHLLAHPDVTKNNMSLYYDDENNDHTRIDEEKSRSKKAGEMHTAL